MNKSLAEKLSARMSGICLYGFAPPKAATPSEQLDGIVAQQLTRLRALPIDGVIVYDIQDEAGRIATPRPFPFLPTIDPDAYAHEHLGSLALPKIVYRCVTRSTPEKFTEWLKNINATMMPQISVLVGAPIQTEVGLSLNNAYALAREHAPDLLLGGIAIAERHARSLNEHERIVAKTAMGCRFFVTQAVYDVTSTKSLLSDYALAVREKNVVPLPLILTFSACGSLRTLSFMKWLGISVPRWLENELRIAADPLVTSMKLCDSIFAEIWDFARDKGIPLGINVESVSIRKAEIEASVELLQVLRRRMEKP